MVAMVIKVATVMVVMLVVVNMVVMVDRTWREATGQDGTGKTDI